MSSQPLRALPARPLPAPEAAPARVCTVITPRAEIRLPASAFTLEGFREWAKSDEVPDHAKVTFVDQEIIIDMSGEELQAHAVVKSAVCYPLLRITDELDLGFFLLDGALVTNEAANVSNIPDATLATWDSLEADRVRLVPSTRRPGCYQELEGTPDWVLEIVSDSSVTKDTRRLRNAYHRAGIPEYWLIDARGEEVTFQILLHQPDGYGPAPGRGGWQTSRVFRHRFKLERFRGRLGYWRFQLHAKPTRAR